MKLSADEMYNKYAEAESLRKSNFESMMHYLAERDEARNETEAVKNQIGVLKGVIKSLSEML